MPTDPWPLASQSIPSQKPVRSFTSPSLTDVILTERLDRTAADYQELQHGAPHPDSANYPNHVLLKQEPMSGDWKSVIRIWGSPNNSQDWFNYAIKYTADNGGYPIYIRQYKELRSTYSRRANGSSLDAVVSVSVTDGGSGYTSAPDVTFSSGGGSGAAATAVINAAGEVAEIVITNGGSGYTSAPTVTVAAPASGSTATAVAAIQPTGAVLVQEYAEPMPDGAQEENLFWNVTRIYQVLPGPWIYSTKLDPDNKVVTIKHRDNIASAITSGEALSSGTWTKTTKVGGDADYVAKEVVESRAIPGDFATSKKFNRFGGLDLIKKKLSDGTVTPTQSSWTTQELESQTTLVAELIETIIASGSSITVYENTDPNIPGSRHTVTYQLVLAAASVPPDTTTEVYETLEYPENSLLRILKKTTYSIPSSYTSEGSALIEYRDAGYSFPTLFESMVMSEITGVTRKSREGFSVIVPHRVKTYFTTSVQTITPIQIIPADYVVFSAHFSGIMNAETVTLIKDGSTYTYDVDASSPDLYTYNGMIGSWQPVGGTSELWRAGIFKTTIIEVKMQ
jgi:hypothetical protein